ncbi:ABC1 family-domain-containing protein [Lipomyces oligophaga]|uniref:ABC1 family-domain-containing protein n=1 Tax=Lipomyces oligophaga TaxID=45792 RepID=UPI0034CE5291
MSAFGKAGSRLVSKYASLAFAVQSKNCSGIWRNTTSQGERLSAGVRQLRFQSTLNPIPSTARAAPVGTPPSSPPPPPRKWLRRVGYTAAALGIMYTIDKTLLASSITRNLRAVVTLSIIAADYKINFTEEHDIDALHNRVAERIYNLITTNGGLYIKIGQAIAMQAQVLPPVFQKKFAKLFDGAPQDDWPEIEKIFIQDFGVKPTDVFETINTHAIASASVAQVHKAQLKTGEWVAVKIQHPSIQKQMSWDLGAYRMIMYIYDRFVFDIPVYFTVDFTCNRLEAETNFLNEAHNGEVLRDFVEKDSNLCNKVYIPKVYDELSSKRVLTMEWIDGVSMSNREELQRRNWSAAQIMDSMVNLFAAQIFSWGVVHCDPHPGNIIIRTDPANNKKLQLVLIDHGLYIYERDEFRRQYCELWRNMFLLNDAKIKEIVMKWGVGSPDLFASAVMLRPYKGDHRNSGRSGRRRFGRSRKSTESMTPEERREAFREQEKMREHLRNFLQDTTKVPLELIFLGRNMRIVQGCNQLMGSPVNRLKILAGWASRSLATEQGLSIGERFRETFNHMKFLAIVGLSDVGFYVSRLRQIVFRQRDAGFEDLLAQQIKGVAKDKLGLEIEDGAFEG